MLDVSFWYLSISIVRHRACVDVICFQKVILNDNSSYTTGSNLTKHSHEGFVGDPLQIKQDQIKYLSKNITPKGVSYHGNNIVEDLLL